MLSLPAGALAVGPALVDTRAEYDHLFSIYVPIAVAVFAVVVAAMAFAVLRYRGRPPERAARWYEANVLEAGYVALLAAIVVVLLVLTFRSEHRVDTAAAQQRPGLVVDVTAAKWEWHFHYPSAGVDVFSGVAGQSDLVVPTGTPVLFHMNAVDVIHALWVPALRFKRDLIPGAVSNSTLVFARPGVFSGECAEFCGLLHSSMIFTVRALAPDRFAAWLSAQRRSGGAPA
jgi:cytochrome c oxidase subunit 2